MPTTMRAENTYEPLQRRRVPIPKDQFPTCPRCTGTGKVRDASLLPWNNWAAFAIILGLAGMIGSACFGDNGRALLLGGLLSSAIGAMLYLMGESCPECEGAGRVEKKKIEEKKRKKQDTVRITYVGVSAPNDQTASKRPGPRIERPATSTSHD